MQHRDASSDSARSWRSLLFQNVPVRVLLTVPSLLQIVVIVALTGWLSWWQGQQAVKRFAFQLQSEIAERVQLRLKTYLATPQLITQINKDDVQVGQLDLNNPVELEQVLFRQIMQFDSVSSILIGTETGYLRAVNRRSGLRLLQVDPTMQGQVQEYRLNVAGEKTEPLSRFGKPEVQQSVWYQTAILAHQPVWSPIFQTADNRDLSLNASVPIYDPRTGEPLGVASAGVVLSVINQFLDNLQVSPAGQVFIVERNGKLIGTSTGASPYFSYSQNGKVKLTQIAAIDSQHPLIQQTARQLQRQFGGFSNIRGSQQLVFSQNGEREYVRIVPYRDSLGLDWLIVVVMPETDFTAHLANNTRNTLLVCLAAAGTTLLLSGISSNWIAQSMLQLSRASQSIAKGNLNQRLPQDGRIREMRVTARAFNQMAEKLSRSFQQIEAVNSNLEAQVRQHTQQLRQTLEFEDLLRRITEKVRDSLDEAQILQTAVRELALSLKVEGCDVALYDLEAGTSTICYEYLCVDDLATAQGKSITLASLPELYGSLLQRQPIQFCFTEPSLGASRNERIRFTYLACPLMDDQGVLGDLWLFKPKQHFFSLQEIRLVQQIANQCAIALRQSQLYQTAQAQVKELEHLHRVKDDFLSTVSHELRTPMANIKMAIQLLEMGLEQFKDTDWATASMPAASVYRYLQILKDEGQREITLINDLLDLSRLDAGTEPYVPTTIDPKVWIPHVVEPFVERARMQQQQLRLDISPAAPPITTDLSNLERILSELLNNACKYTPAGEQISVRVTQAAAVPQTVAALPAKRKMPFCRPSPTALLISVSNSGIEIPDSEHERIFDKFYRIPSNDPWKHGGTGLGLALVKGLVERLGGEIRVESGNGLTTFMLQLPIERKR